MLWSTRGDVDPGIMEFGHGKSNGILKESYWSRLVWTLFISQVWSSHVRPWPGTHRETESKATLETPGSAIWRLKQRGLFTPGDNLRDWPRMGMPAELLQLAYAPAGAKGNDGYVLQLLSQSSTIPVGLSRSVPWIYGAWHLNVKQPRKTEMPSYQQHHMMRKEHTVSTKSTGNYESYPFLAWETWHINSYQSTFLHQQQPQTMMNPEGHTKVAPIIVVYAVKYDLSLYRT